jgi:hypothetical protein
MYNRTRRDFTFGFETSKFVETSKLEIKTFIKNCIFVTSIKNQSV